MAVLRLCCSAWLCTMVYGLLWLSPAQAAGVSFALGTRPASANFRLFNAKGKVVREGKTPFVGLLPPGQYRLTIEKGGYFREARTIVLLPGQPKVLQIQLMQAHKASQIPLLTRPSPRRRKLSGQRPVTSPSSDTSTKPPVRKKSKVPDTNREIPSPRQRIRPQHGEMRPVSRQTKKKRRKKRKPSKSGIPWIPLISTGALAIGGGVFYAISGSYLTTSRDRNNTQVEAFAAYGQARSYRSTGNFLLIACGAAALVTGFLFFWQPSSRNKVRSRQDIPIVGQAMPQRLEGARYRTITLHRSFL